MKSAKQNAKKNSKPETIEDVSSDDEDDDEDELDKIETIQKSQDATPPLLFCAQKVKSRCPSFQATSLKTMVSDVEGCVHRFNGRYSSIK